MQNCKCRPDHNPQNIRANIFPVKRRKIEALEVSSSVNTKERSLLSSVSTPILPMQVAHTLPSVTDEVANKGEFRAIIWNEPSIMKKRRLEEILEGSKNRADYHPSWNLRTEGGRLLLDMACRLVQSTVPPEISNELMTKLLPDICKWMQYRFANVSGCRFVMLWFSNQLVHQSFLLPPRMCCSSLIIGFSAV